jgi:hypothetical protein
MSATARVCVSSIPGTDWLWSRSSSRWPLFGSYIFPKPDARSFRMHLASERGTDDRA